VGPGCTGVLVTNAEAADVTGCRIRPSARKAAAAERPDVITRRGRALARPSEIAGIVVAGQIAREVRVAHNDILAERVGIRVALSRRARRSDREVVERVIVEGNRVSLAGARALAGRMRGIFIGNCESAIVCHNRLEAMIQGRKGDREELPDSRRVVKEDGTRADAGILMFGAFGRFANVRANHLSNWRTGIRMVAINMRDDKQARPLWVFAENLAERTDTVVDLPPIAINQHNQG
jgi:hypothetical protein